MGSEEFRGEEKKRDNTQKSEDLNEKRFLLKIQDIEYDALVQLNEICKKNHLKFYLRGGSALGAVKYQGFVPWDDDIDIVFCRDDYLKLITIMPRFFGEYYQFVSYQKIKNAHCYFPRVILTKRGCKELGIPTNNERGFVLIDILPLDGMPDGFFLRKIHILKSYIYRALASLWTLDVKDTINRRKGIGQLLLKILHTMNIYRLYEQDTIYRRMDKMFARYPYGKMQYSGMMVSSKLEKEIVKSAWWGMGKKMKFREIYVQVPSNYDGYLKRLFGENYIEYEPAISDRKASHLAD